MWRLVPYCPPVHQKIRQQLLLSYTMITWLDDWPFVRFVWGALPPCCWGGWCPHSEAAGQTLSVPPSRNHCHSVASWSVGRKIRTVNIYPGSHHNWKLLKLFSVYRKVKKQVQEVGEISTVFICPNLANSHRFGLPFNLYIMPHFITRNRACYTFPFPE